MCGREDGKAVALSALGAAELGASIGAYYATDDGDHPGVIVPILAFQNVYTYGVSDALIDRDRALGRPYTPEDRLSDLLAAPFNLEVMKRPRVWAGLLVDLALGIGVSLLLTDDDDIDPGGRPNVFGRDFRAGVGYPLAGLTGAALFSHVAIGEETLFRGVLQSRFAAGYGETHGWLAASALFGLAHVPNALEYEGKEQRDYLLYAVPLITAGGLYLGWTYKEEGYSLAPPVALHFWYDFLLSATFYVLNPRDSILSATITLPF